MSGEDNKGDGIVLCDKDPEQAVKDKGWDSTRYKVCAARPGRWLKPFMVSALQSNQPGLARL